MEDPLGFFSISFGPSSVTCPVCSGQRSKKEAEYASHGFKEGSYRTGRTVTVYCPACHGVGKVKSFETRQRYSECYKCYGRGELIYQTWNLYPDGNRRSLKSEKKVTCPHCGGKGKFPEKPEYSVVPLD